MSMCGLHLWLCTLLPTQGNRIGGQHAHSNPSSPRSWELTKLSHLWAYDGLWLAYGFNALSALRFLGCGQGSPPAPLLPHRCKCNCLPARCRTPCSGSIHFAERRSPVRTTCLVTSTTSREHRS